MGIGFNRLKTPVDFKNIDVELPNLLKLVEKLSGVENSVDDLRHDFTKEDVNSQEIIARLNTLDKDFAQKLKDEISKISYDLDNDVNDEKFATLIKTIAEDRKKSKSTDAAFEFKKYTLGLNDDKKKSSKSTKIDVNDEYNFSTDEITNQELKAKIDAYYNISDGNISSKDKKDLSSTLDSDLIKSLSDELNALSLNSERLSRQLLTAKDKKDKKGVEKAQKQIDSTNETKNTIIEIISQLKENTSKSGKTNSFDPKVLKELNSLHDVVKNQKTNGVDEKSSKLNKAFEKLTQGSMVLGKQLDDAITATGHFSKAFSSVGDGTKSFGQTKDVFEDLARLLMNLKSPIVAIGLAMAVAAKAIGMYHDQLNISREMGDNSGNMINDLQKMHIRTLVDPEQMKKLSDDISAKFNVSLTKNQSELEKTAIKQRLTERVMGKEYASEQIEAISSLKNVMTGSSPTELMDELANQTSALAKTMGISNKMALNQIKAMEQNTKVLTKGLNKDIAAKIQKTFAEMESGLVNAGVSAEAASEITGQISEKLASRDETAKEQRNIQTMLAGGGVGADEYKKQLNSMDISQEKAMTLLSEVQVKGFQNMSDKDKALIQKIMVASTVSQSIANEDLASKIASGNATDKEINQKQIYDQAGLTSNSSIANAYNKNPNKFTENMKQGQKNKQEQSKGADNTQDFNKILVAMGATDQKSKDEKIKSLYASSSEDQKKSIDKLIKENNLSMEDAYKNVMGDSIKQGSKDLSDGKGITLSGQSVSDSRAKEIQTMEKDPVAMEKAKGNLSATGIEIKKDQVETLATEALYTFQNAIMDLVNNIKLLIAGGIVFLAAQLLSLGKGPLTTFGKGLSDVGSKVWSYATDKLVDVGKKQLSIMGSIGTGLWGLTTDFSGTTKKIGASLEGTWSNFTTKVKSLMPGKNSEGNISQKSDKTFLQNISDGWSNVTTKIKNIASGKPNEPKVSGNKLGEGVDVSVKSNKTFSQSVSDTWATIKSSTSKGITGIGEGLKSMKGMIGPAALAGAAMMAFQGALDGWGKAGDWFAKSISDLPALTEEEAKKLSKSGKVVKDEAGNYIDAVSGEIIKRSATFAQKSASALGGAIEAVTFGMLDGQTMAYKIADAFTWLGEEMDSSGISNTFSSLGSAFKEYMGVVMSFWKSVFQLISPVFTILGQVFKSIFSAATGIFDIISGVFNMDFGKIASGFTKIFNAPMDIIGSVFTGIFDIAGNLLDAMGMQGLAGFMRDIADGIKIIFDAWNTTVGGFFEILSAPFQGFKAWFNGEMDLTDAVGKMVDVIISGLSKIIEGIISPFKGLFNWLHKKMQSLGLADSDEKNQADEISKKTTESDKKKGDELYKKLDMGASWGVGSMSEKDLREKVTKNKLSQQDVEQLIAGGETTDNEKESLVKILEEMKTGFVKADISTIKDGASKDDKKAGDALAKKLQINGYWDTSDETIRKRVDDNKVSDDDLKKLIASNDTSSDEKDSLLKILNERLAKLATPGLVNAGIQPSDVAAAKEKEKIVGTDNLNAAEKSLVVKVEPKELPAKAEGGSTGGLGDVFAKMILPDTSKEQPVATVGTDEFVFNKEMIENQMKIKNATSNTSYIASSLGMNPLPNNNTVTGDISNLKSKSVDESKPGFFSSFFKGTEDVGKTTLTNFSDVLTGKGSPTEAITDVGTSITSTIPESGKQMTDNMGAISENVTKQFNGMVNGDTVLSNSISNVGTDINDKAVVPITDVFTSFGASFSSMFKGMVSKVKNTETYKSVSKFATDVIEKSKGFMSDITGFIHKSETGKREGDYGAAKDIGDGAGISFGAYQMTEKSGGIKAFLDKMAADGDTKAAELSKQFNAKGNAFGGNKADLTSYLKEAGASDKGKAVQDDIYAKKYLEPALKLAEKKGITDKAAIAQIVDHSVNAGVGGAERMLNKADGTSADDIANARKKDYQSLGNYDKYGKAWEARVDNNLAAFKAYQGISISTPDKVDGVVTSNQAPNIPTGNSLNSPKGSTDIVSQVGVNIPSNPSNIISTNNLGSQTSSGNTVTNNTTNNNVSSSDKNLQRLVDLTQVQVNQQQQIINESAKQTKQFQKDYKSSVDKSDNNRQQNITKNQNSVV